MPPPREILDLVARFEQQLDAYKSGQYNETQVRREFLDPFFKALGWDIDNVQGFAEAYKDVIGPDFYQQSELPLLTDEERYRINVFDWQAEFPEIFRSSRRESAQTDSVGKDGADSRRLLQGDDGGGFDAVIGNPPYVRQESLARFKDYFEQHYEASDGVADLYTYFVENPC